MNINWAQTLIDILLEQGVEDFCLAPGNRLAPLSVALSQTPKAKTWVHFDERGVGFHALGKAKALKKPVAIVVTSGTALGNLLPAVMEASHAGIPLILLTADRPAELRDTMANQTCDQLKIFGSYVRHFFDLPSPCDDLPANFLGTTLAQAVALAQFPLPGPVHINCPFQEPLLTKDELPYSTKGTRYTFPQLTLPQTEMQRLAEKLQQVEKGVIVLGENGSNPHVHTLAKKLNWPILSDITSSHRELSDDMSIPYYHHILKGRKDLDAELILHFGGAVVSKELLLWMKNKNVIHVAEHPRRCDPMHTVSEKVVAFADSFCEGLLPLLFQKTDEWLHLWKQLSQRVEEAVPSTLSSVETSLIPSLIDHLTKEKALYLGNSMPIRDADMFFFPKTPCGPIFANRGVSGIDGNIATCSGIATVMPVVALIGDQTFLHDLNSLAQISKCTYPVQLIVVNNGGGGIFSFMEIGKTPEILDPYFAAAHNTAFEEAAKLFSLPYYTTLDGLKEKGSCLIEIASERAENLIAHETIDEALTACNNELNPL